MIFHMIPFYLYPKIWKSDIISYNCLLSVRVITFNNTKVCQMFEYDVYLIGTKSEGKK